MLRLPESKIGVLIRRNYHPLPSLKILYVCTFPLLYIGLVTFSEGLYGVFGINEDNYYLANPQTFLQLI